MLLESSGQLLLFNACRNADIRQAPPADGDFGVVLVWSLVGSAAVWMLLGDLPGPGRYNLGGQAGIYGYCCVLGMTCKKAEHFMFMGADRKAALWRGAGVVCSGQRSSLVCGQQSGRPWGASSGRAAGHL